jgi:glycosyltransferase involved in cell wall biosynthesis
MSVVAPFTSPVTAAIAKRGMPTVVTVHSLWRSIQPIPALAAGVYGLWNAPVVWSAVSRLAAEHVQQVLPSSPRVMVLPNAVQVSARARTPVRELDAPVELVSTMRIARRKRPLQLLDMFDRLQRSTSTDVRLTVVGDGPMRPRLAREIARRGLSRKITVTGRLEPQEVTVRLAEADVYVAPAVLESFGLAALEARCVGLPIVGRADSGMTDFISDGVEGSLSFSDAGMVDDLRDLVEDRPMLHRISEHNRTTDAGLTWERALAANDVAYDTAVAPTRLRRRRLVDDGAGG